MVLLGTALLELASVRTWHIPLAASCIFQSTRFTFFSSKQPSSLWTIDNVRQFFIYRCSHVWRYYDFPLYTKSTNGLYFLMRSCKQSVFRLREIFVSSVAVKTLYIHAMLSMCCKHLLVPVIISKTQFVTHRQQILSFSSHRVRFVCL